MAIVDDGLDFNHPDVKDNYASVGSTDVNFHKADPMPFSFDGHGTSAAGCSSAIANNAQCGVGTAPESKISGIRLIAESTTDVDEAEGCSFFFFFFCRCFFLPFVGPQCVVFGKGLGFRLDVNHILSSSWGPYDDGMRLEGPGNFLMRAFENGAKSGEFVVLLHVILLTIRGKRSRWQRCDLHLGCWKRSKCQRQLQLRR